MNVSPFKALKTLVAAARTDVITSGHERTIDECEGVLLVALERACELELAMPRKYLSFSTVTPKVPGWYFYRLGKYVDVCEVRPFDIENSVFQFSREGTEWAGPIPEPRETK